MLVDVALFDLAPRRDMVACGDQRVLGEFALGDFDLAASADAASAAHRIEADAELARRFEHADAIRDFAAFAGGGENDKPGRHCSASRAPARRREGIGDAAEPGVTALESEAEPRGRRFSSRGQVWVVGLGEIDEPLVARQK